MSLGCTDSSIDSPKGSKTICHEERHAPGQKYASVSCWELGRHMLERPKPGAQVALATYPQGALCIEAERTNFDQILTRKQPLMLSFLSHVI